MRREICKGGVDWSLHFSTETSSNEVGFKLCRSNVSLTHAPTTLRTCVGNHTRKYWRMSQRGSATWTWMSAFRAPAFPGICPSEYSCTIEHSEFWERASLNVVSFDTESMMHCISTTSVVQATRRTSLDCRVLSPPPPFTGRQITATPRAGWRICRDPRHATLWDTWRK